MAQKLPAAMIAFFIPAQRFDQRIKHSPVTRPYRSDLNDKSERHCVLRARYLEFVHDTMPIYYVALGWVFCQPSLFARYRIDLVGSLLAWQYYCKELVAVSRMFVHVLILPRLL